MKIKTCKLCKDEVESKNTHFGFCFSCYKVEKRSYGDVLRKQRHLSTEEHRNRRLKLKKTHG